MQVWAPSITLKRTSVYGVTMQRGQHDQFVAEFTEHTVPTTRTVRLKLSAKS